MVTQLTFTDADIVGTHEWSIDGGDPKGVFAVDDLGRITVADPSTLDFEANPSYSLVLRLTNGSLVSETKVTINVQDVNDNAPVIAPVSAMDVSEDAGSGTVVGQLTFTDSDVVGTHEWSIASGDPEGVFAIDRRGRITVVDPSSLDFETTPSYSLALELTNGSLTTETRVAINVQDVNDNAPVIAPTVPTNVSEAADTGTLVTQLAFRDADTIGTHVWSIVGGDSDGVFEIDDAGRIRVANPSSLDFENTQAYTLDVTLTNGLLTDATRVTIDVDDVNDNAPVIAPVSPLSVSELAARGTVVGQLSLSDVDTVGSHDWLIGGDPDGIFRIDNSGQITIADPAGLDFETTEIYDLTVSVRNGLLSDTVSVSVNVLPENDLAPVLTGESSLVVAENERDIGVLTAFDGDKPADSLSFLISGGPDADLFTIDPVTGLLSFTAPQDFEAPSDSNGDGVYMLAVQVSDGALSSSARYEVRLSDVNEAPANISMDADSIEENRSGVVATVAVQDVDASDSHEFTVSDDRFEIIDGELRVRDAIDFESEESVSLTITATDSGDLQTSQTFEVDVIDELVAEADRTERALAEDAGTLSIPVTQLFSNIPDEPVQYIVSYDDRGRELAVADVRDGALQITLNADEFGEGSVTVTARTSTETAETAIDLTVAPVNDVPVGERQGFTITNGQGSLQGDLLAAAVDVDRDSLSVVLVGDAPENFQLNPDGTFTYDMPSTPPETVEFTFFITDGFANSELITEVIEINQGVGLDAGNNSQPSNRPTIASDLDSGDSDESTQVDTAVGTGTGPTAQEDRRESVDLSIKGSAALTLGAQGAEVDEAIETSSNLLPLIGQPSDASADNSVSREITRYLTRQDGAFEDAGTVEARAQAVIREQRIFSKRMNTRVGAAIDSIESDLERGLSQDVALVRLSTGGITGLSVGYIIWLLRGGSLVASMLTSIPAWRMVDPLPILDLLEQTDDDGDSLDSLIDKNQKKLVADGESVSE